MTTFDPADTFSGTIPSLPPLPPDDPWLHHNGGPLDVLHPWHPWDDDHTEATPFFTRLINECGVFATMFAVEERERARAADAGEPPVRRFAQPLPPIGTGPAALPPPPLPMLPPPPYAELTPAARDADWDTGPAAAIPAAGAEPPVARLLTGAPPAEQPRRRHDLRGPFGRFISRNGGA